MRDFLKIYKTRQKKAATYIPIIIEECEKHDVDPLLIGLIISKESSWLPNVRGFAKKEKGLMQVHPKGVCANGQNLNTPRGQIKAGVKCFRLSLNKCGGSTIQALNMYATGRCKPIIKSARKRYREYKKLKRKYDTNNANN
jgi:soluble lytic murein transglycosylase-like protein